MRATQQFLHHNDVDVASVDHPVLADDTDFAVARSAVKALAMLVIVECVEHDLMESAVSRVRFEAAEQRGADASAAARSRDVNR